jgi:hypothetical protein
MNARRIGRLHGATMMQPNMTTSRLNLQRFIVAQQPLYACVGRTQGWPQADTVDIHPRGMEWIRAKIGVDLRRLRPAHTHCSFHLISEPVKVFVKAAIHVAFDSVCSQIADQRCFRSVGS